MDYCSIVHSPSLYVGKTVHFRAFMTWSTVTRVDGGDSFFFSDRCNSGDYFSHTGFTKTANSKKVLGFFNRLKPEANYIFEVDVVGKYDSAFPALFGHLSWTLHDLQLKEIISIKDITTLRPDVRPDFHAETPITDTGLEISDVTTDTILYFMGYGNLSYVPRFSPDLTVTDPSGNVVSGGGVSTFISRGLFYGSQTDQHRFVSHPSIKLIGEMFVAKGKAGITLVSKDKKILKYECTFKRSGESLVLEKIKFSN